MRFLTHYTKHGQYLFTVLSFLPNLLVVSAYTERKREHACAQMYTPPTTADPQKPGPCVLCFCPRLSFHTDFLMPREAFPSVGHHLSCHPLFRPTTSMMPIRASLSLFPISSGWNGLVGPKTAAQKGKNQAGRAVHTHSRVQKGSAITRFISLGNQIKKQSTFRQL